MALNKDLASLRKRWRSGAGKDLQKQIELALRQGDALDRLSLPRVEGRLDLRGINISSEVSELRERHIVDADFTGASLANIRIMSSRIRNCRFDFADCRFWFAGGSRFEECSFEGADLRDSMLGERQGSVHTTFHGVAFASTKMARVSTRTARYVECTFRDAQLDGINFWQSHLVRCKFSGVVRNVVFDGRSLGDEGGPNPMLEVDFSDAVIDGCDFRGVDFTRVRPPSDPDVLVITDRRTLEDARHALSGSGGGLEARIAGAIFDQALANFSQGGNGAVLNLRDLEQASGVALAALKASGWSSGLN